ncbi:Eco57I restriction-modification methylase domain-containing protein [Siphonobacter sp. SORGH_AS_1065]|uniref:type IIG restriction enzyme/methyltransferase n=1 Tax=Siphonobacter sp. SORGH_AS_1065 TaxID=3041795 RepID=UPI0027D8B1DD|nr:Eco57I restriction-modification methylase domain-containing protein [Siphonobacter sp. SORGH_AS_1065]
MLDQVHELESEEFHKNIVSRFLEATYYSPNHYINTKGRNDLVIHNGNSSHTSVGVILEIKKPTNKAEMLSLGKLNTKAFQELLLYYLRERITGKNIEIKHVIASNIYEWFIFDGSIFERVFAQNKRLVQKFIDFEAGRLGDRKTEYFYKEIAEPAISTIQIEVPFTHFDIREFNKPLRNQDKQDDHQLIALYKLLSPEHLLKLPFANDSNSLDKSFYSELLHIIGLTETKDGSKRIIERKKEGERDKGSLMENAISQIDSLDKLSRFDKPSQFGNSSDERFFNVSLELVITWVNRILFLKLLEAQLIKYNSRAGQAKKSDSLYAFLNTGKIKNYDDLNSLFFQVLARKPEKREPESQKLFSTVPYLNSSLFEPTEMEHVSIFISNLRDDYTLPILSTTVLKTKEGKKRTGELNALEYFFEFLNAYEFSGEGSEEIQEDNKTLINASVLGLIFEKINGYKDGSFFTPGFITMYMCRETIRKAVVQKFNEVKGWSCVDIDHLYDEVKDRDEANQIINSLKICDPAVGSGHFLVSALNEIISIKNDLEILLDRTGKRRLKGYHIEVVNDELIITDEDGLLFEYNPNNPESQRVQETIFHEKQTIIENCLFGVDLNPNSVKICRLRLWIELLKNAYYTTAPHNTTARALETLPNIDINIKWGNSLVSRYGLDADLSQALKKNKISIESYKAAVQTYRNAENKDQKREMEQLINRIKSDFRTEINNNDPKKKKLFRLNGELYNMTQHQLFAPSKAEAKLNKQKQDKLKKEIDQLETHIEEIKNNKMFENAFEWRFEFPEVLDDDGDFVGFDVLLGNPPYVQLQKMGTESSNLQKIGYQTFESTGDIYSLFYENGWNVLKSKGFLCFITSNKWMRAGYGVSTRQFFAEKTNPILLIDFAGLKIFASATVDTNILMFSKEKNQGKTLACVAKEEVLNNMSLFVSQHSSPSAFVTNASWVVSSLIEQRIKAKIEAMGIPLKDWNINIYRGILTGYNEAFIIDGKKKDELVEQDTKSAEIIRPILRGRDIKRYAHDYADLWLINTHNGIKEKDVSPINIEDYPAIKNYLNTFYPTLSNEPTKG